ncbi:MAG: hypothetical protein JNL82_29775 [Myxococcales bacterium]|nr:hypothetical protein [Myxococcales bacterium]
MTLAKYYAREPRALAREFRQMLVDADQDSDVVSLTLLAPAHVHDFDDAVLADGAVVVIKGGKYIELFRQWAAQCGLLTTGKPISDAHRGRVPGADVP